MLLSDAAVRNTKATDKTLRLKDERGLYLEVSPAAAFYGKVFAPRGAKCAPSPLAGLFFVAGAKGCDLSGPVHPCAWGLHGVLSSFF